MEKKEKNDSFLFVLLLIVMVLLLCTSFVGIFFMIKENQNLREEVENLKETADDKEEKETEDDVDDENETSLKCSVLDGKYYGELIDDTMHMMQTYVFERDGSYITYVENGGGTNGTYTISNGTIYFTQKPELGPSSETYTYFYNVSDDCKEITAYSGDQEYTLTLVEE